MEAEVLVAQRPVFHLVVVAGLVLEPPGQALQEAVGGLLAPQDVRLEQRGARRGFARGAAAPRLGVRDLVGPREGRPQLGEALQRPPVGAREVVELREVRGEEVQGPKLEQHFENDAPLRFPEQQHVLHGALLRRPEGDLRLGREHTAARELDEVLAHHPHQAIHGLALVEVSTQLREVLESNHCLRSNCYVGDRLVAQGECRHGRTIHDHLQHVALRGSGRGL
mmetsp:Transcript_76153/g.198066  ORF Transcript_76153/g.198066 Transcript_76153/m.198066 type:complete len:224 (+) Transcript_76153:1626-2297(+)